MSNEYDPHAGRRQDDTAMLNLLTEMHKDVREQNMKFDALSNKLTIHMTEETHELANEVAKLMQAAFPDGDPLTHRRKHEIEIEAAKARAAFWKDLASSVSKWGILGVAGWLAVIVWKAFLLGPKS